MQADNAPVEGETAETIHEPIPVKDSSLEPLPQKKKPGNIGADTRKIPSSPKVTSTPKEKKEKKAATGKGEKTTNTVRKLVSTKSANSSPDADALKVSFFFIYPFSRHFV